MKQKTLNLNGCPTSLQTPQVMGIMNVTPDSFYAGSRIAGAEEIRRRATQIITEGGSIIDIGAYSSRPKACDISIAEEIDRLRPALQILRDEYPDTPISVDTFRADVARMAVQEYGASMINDISGGEMDDRMFATIAQLGVPYILMHMRGTPQTMTSLCDYGADLVSEIVDYFVQRVARLRELGQTDIIIDAGYGFAKDTEQNFRLLARQEEALGLLELPILVGISRKSMIYKTLGKTAEESLNGTTVLNTYALMHGAADILRVHDVWAATEAVKLVCELRKYESDAGSTQRMRPQS